MYYDIVYRTREYAGQDQYGPYYHVEVKERRVHESGIEEFMVHCGEEGYEILDTREVSPLELINESLNQPVMGGYLI